MSGLGFGIVLPIQGKDVDLSQLWDELVEETVAAERAGFDAVFLPEFHQARGGALVSPLVLGAALLQATSTIRFGQCVLALPLHHPVRLAEDLLMLDWTSRGRVMAGVGLGHQPPDFEAYGVPHDRRGEIFEEALEILHRALAGEPFTFHGRHYSLSAAVTPHPRTHPRPEIWIGAHGRKGLARAAAHGDRWVSDPQRDVRTVARLSETYREAAGAASRPARVAMFREAWIGESRAECEQLWGPHVLAMHRLYYNVGAYRRRFEPWVDEVADRHDFTFDRLAPGRFLHGSATDIRETLEEWTATTGADYLALRFRQPGGPGHAQTLEAIERFGAEVVAPLTAGVAA